MLFYIKGVFSLPQIVKKQDLGIEIQTEDNSRLCRRKGSWGVSQRWWGEISVAREERQGWGLGQLADHFPGVHKTLGSIPSVPLRSMNLREQVGS